MNYNRIIIIGRLTRDPEPRSTPSGVPVTSFSVAVDRPQSADARQQGQQKETDFFDVVTWRQLAENAANYLQKGKLVVVEGRLQIRNYVGTDGQQRKAVEIVADAFRNLERRQDGDGYGEEMGGSQVSSAPSGGRDAYAPAPQRNAAPPREEAPARGGYEQRPAPTARPAQGGAPAGRSGGRPAPPPAATNYDDDFQDPFDE